MLKMLGFSNLLRLYIYISFILVFTGNEIISESRVVHVLKH